MPQLLLHSASFSGIQSPFWSHHSLCQSIPFSPVWGPLSVLLYSVKLVRMGSLVRLICILNPGEARHGRRMRALARRQVGSGELERLRRVSALFLRICSPCMASGHLRALLIIYSIASRNCIRRGFWFFFSCPNCNQHGCL